MPFFTCLLVTLSHLTKTGSGQNQDRLGTRQKKHNRRNPLNNSVGVRVFFSLHTLSITQEHFSDGGWVELGLDLPADYNDDEEEDDDGGAGQADGWPADGDDGSDHDNGGGGGGGGGGARGKLREGVPRSPGQLHELEVVHAVVDTYLWLVRKPLRVESAPGLF
jgi:hypothetical protein